MTTEPGTKIHHFARNERPMCDECQKQMWLFSIKPADLSLELRTYECAACSASKTLLVKMETVKNHRAVSAEEGAAESSRSFSFRAATTPHRHQ